MRILITGGTGFIGSHVAVQLIENGHEVVLFDNLTNSDAAVVDAVETITGHRPTLVVGDIRDGEALRSTLTDLRIEGVIHCAGLKSVAESVEKPVDYYENNVGGTLELLKAMRACGIKTLIFSSSATVYGEPQSLPISETHPTGKPTNPYGRSKLMVEEILQDLALAEPDMHLVTLRYFNPIGAHPSGLIGENPKGRANNLLPHVARAAAGETECVLVCGDDYPTPDGTGVRDYIHVVDLADGHVKALAYGAEHAGLSVFNLGCGRGYSVLEVIAAFERACGKPVARKVVARRPGDIASNYSDPTRANTLLGWTARRDLEDMCRDAWRFQSRLKSES